MMPSPIQKNARSNMSIKTAPMEPSRDSLSPEEPLVRVKSAENRPRSGSIISRLKGDRSPTLSPSSLPHANHPHLKERHKKDRRSRRLSTSSGKVKDFAASIVHKVQEGSVRRRAESDESDTDSDVYDDDLEVTGFAVASNRRNADFHALFPRVDEGDYLIEGASTKVELT